MRPMTSIVARLNQEPFAVRRRRRLGAFRPAYRLDIARLTLNWPKVEDLADSFPALLFALATGYGTAKLRETAFRMVDDGAPLKDVAAALGLPMWLRRIPSEAFTQALPVLPADPDFAAAILPRIPECPRECGIWFDRVQTAFTLAGHDFALWAARDPRLMPPATPDETWQWLLAWSWASRAPRAPGHALLRTAWSAAMTWKRAQEEVGIWRKRIDLVGALAHADRDPWFANGHVLDYDIVGLNTVAAVLAESAAMENCLDQYAAHLAYGRIRVFSVRRDGRPIADVELALRSDDTTMPTIAQVRGPRNRRAPPSVWQAVHAWLGAQPFRSLNAAPTPATSSREALKVFWEPYVQALETSGYSARLVSHLTGAGPRRSPRTRSDSLAAAIREAMGPGMIRRLPGG